MLVEFLATFWFLTALAVLILIVVLPSIRIIGPTEVGLVTKRFSAKKLPEDNPIAFHGEAGYQADLLMPGWHFKLWLVYLVEKHPWVQVRAGEIGVVVAQVGKPLPIGAKSAESLSELNRITDLREWLKAGGQKGVQRPVLPPGSLMPVHPVGFLVITRQRVYGVPVAQEFQRLQAMGKLSFQAFGLSEEQLKVTVITPRTAAGGLVVDTCGIVTALEGQPLPGGAIASRLGEFDDIKKLEAENASDSTCIEALIGSKSVEHNNYQDFDAFLKAGGKIGLQHDPLLYGAYVLNPFLVRVEEVPMLVVKQGEVAVMKAYVGLPTQDTSGAAFKFGSIVRPGHRGIWQEPLRTGKYAINPRCYEAEQVPTAILSLNWSEAISEAHKLDERLVENRGEKPRRLRLCHRIGRADSRPRHDRPARHQHGRHDRQSGQRGVASGRGQPLPRHAAEHAGGAVHRDPPRGAAKRPGTHPRATEPVRSGDPRRVYPGRDPAGGAGDGADAAAKSPIRRRRPIRMQQEAQQLRIDMERAKGTADMQAQLAQAQVGVAIATQTAEARKKQADGEATYIAETGRAKGAEVEAVGWPCARVSRLRCVRWVRGRRR